MANDIDAVVVHEVLDGVAHIRFNRPRQLNALNLELAKSFDATLDDVLSDPSVRVIVLSGKGRAFMAGGDLALFRQAADKAGAAKALIEVIHGSLKRLAATPRLVIASLHGAVAGAGMSLALNADLVIAADDVTF